MEMKSFPDLNVSFKDIMNSYNLIILWQSDVKMESGMSRKRKFDGLKKNEGNEKKVKVIFIIFSMYWKGMCKNYSKFKCL